MRSVNSENLWPAQDKAKKEGKVIYNISEASRVYKVSTKSIYKWLTELGKDHLINKIVSYWFEERVF